MKNITLAIEENILNDVREIAARRRTTINGLVRDYLTQLASEESRVAEARKGLVELMKNSRGRLGPGYVWNREDAYAERLLPRHEYSDLRGGGARRESGKVRSRGKARTK
ncbi:MAG: hypothetical protein ACK41X_02790 [Pseudorhodoplanes sp.]